MNSADDDTDFTAQAVLALRIANMVVGHTPPEGIAILAVALITRAQSCDMSLSDVIAMIRRIWVEPVDKESN